MLLVFSLVGLVSTFFFFLQVKENLFLFLRSSNEEKDTSMGPILFYRLYTIKIIVFLFYFTFFSVYCRYSRSWHSEYRRSYRIYRGETICTTMRGTTEKQGTELQNGSFLVGLLYISLLCTRVGKSFAFSSSIQRIYIYISLSPHG